MTNTVKRLAALLPLGAQNRGMGVQVNSPVVNPDNTVTFNYRNANAKDVKVNVQFAGTHDMTKNENGVWTITLGPAAPDIYPYCFIVDGINVMDPLNPDWFPNETFKNSLVELDPRKLPVFKIFHIKLLLLQMNQNLSSQEMCVDFQRDLVDFKAKNRSCAVALQGFSTQKATEYR